MTMFVLGIIVGVIGTLAVSLWVGSHPDLPR